ncbi:competence type IV pilus minor pilin ComGG [Enterococcus hirae]|nr:competence type IV pilus minor pilin ComGG [Enterococcus hirae]
MAEQQRSYHFYHELQQSYQRQALIECAQYELEQLEEIPENGKLEYSEGTVSYRYREGKYEWTVDLKKPADRQVFLMFFSWTVSAKWRKAIAL